MQRCCPVYLTINPAHEITVLTQKIPANHVIFHLNHYLHLTLCPAILTGRTKPIVTDAVKKFFALQMVSGFVKSLKVTDDARAIELRLQPLLTISCFQPDEG
jgi:hypothetical protein